MRIGSKQVLLLLAISFARIGMSATVSYSGTLASAEDIFETTVTLSGPGSLTLQTWGFGGGTNAAAMAIPAGGFDPLVAVFTGTGGGANFVEGVSDILTNFAGFIGCPPAGTVTIGSIAGNCGDIQMTLSLSGGPYTILLSEGAFIPNAVFDNGTLSEGFTDLTGGAFQTCLDQVNCNNDTANWAMDVTVSGASQAPEPAAWGTACLGLLGLAVAVRIRSGTGNNPWLQRKQERGGVRL